MWITEPVKSQEELDKEKAIRKIERLYRFTELYDHQWEMLKGRSWTGSLGSELFLCI